MARFQFIQEIALEYIGVEYLSAVLKRAGHHVDVVVGTDDRRILREVGAHLPDAVCFSAITGSHHWCLRTAGLIKAAFPSVRVIFGGGHPTFFPEMIRHPSVDMIVRGEAEGAILDIARCIDDRTDCRGVPNVWSKSGERIVENPVRPYLTDEELDLAPFADRALYCDKYPYLARVSVKAFLGQRGCPYSCNFCLNDKLKELYRGKGPHVRRRSPGNLISEIAEVCARYPVRTVHLYDEIFNTSPDWCMAVMDEYRRRVRRPYYCLVRADLMTREIAAKLGESGCAGVWMGVETGDEELRLKVLGKRLPDEKIIAAARLLHEAGIPFRAFCLIGLPDETLDSALKTIEFCIRIKTDYPWCSIYQPYSNTGLVDYCIRKGYLPADFSVDRIESSYYHDSILRLPDRRALMSLHKFFQTAVLFPPSLPLIRRLIKIPPNPLFTLWFGAVYFVTYIRSEGRSLRDAFVFALRYAGIFFGGAGRRSKRAG
ncbi:MAG: radical SAM protein [Chlamydiota bacterium]